METRKQCSVVYWGPLGWSWCTTVKSWQVLWYTDMCADLTHYNPEGFGLRQTTCNPRNRSCHTCLDVCPSPSLAGRSSSLPLLTNEQMYDLRRWKWSCYSEQSVVKTNSSMANINKNKTTHWQAGRYLISWAFCGASQTQTWLPTNRCFSHAPNRWPQQQWHTVPAGRVHDLLQDFWPGLAVAKA